VRAVGSTLTKAYTKLGVNSRIQLAERRARPGNQLECSAFTSQHGPALARQRMDS